MVKVFYNNNMKNLKLEFYNFIEKEKDINLKDIKIIFSDETNPNMILLLYYEK